MLPTLICVACFHLGIIEKIAAKYNPAAGYARGGVVVDWEKALQSSPLGSGEKSNHFSDDMCVRKILLGRQCTQRVRAADRNSFWQ